MAITMELSKITFPNVYVREQVKKSHWQELGAVVALANGVKDWRELISSEKKFKKISWPFEPIVIAKLSSDEKEEIKEELEGEKKKETDKPVVPTYEIVDGVHRFTLLQQLKQVETEVIVKALPDASERFLEAFKSSSSHGLRLSKDERDQAIKTMVKKLKMKVEHVARETGLHKASISRIANSKQRKTTPHASKGKKRGAKGAKGESASKGFIDSPQAFIERMVIHVQMFKKNERKELEAMFAITKPNMKTMANLSEGLFEMSEFFEQHSKA